MGLTPSSSLKTLGNADRICSLTEDSTLATVGHGNEAGIMASLIIFFCMGGLPHNGLGSSTL